MPVKVLVGKNFNRIVFNRTMTVFVMFCKCHCFQIAFTWSTGNEKRKLILTYQTGLCSLQKSCWANLWCLMKALKKFLSYLWKCCTTLADLEQQWEIFSPFNKFLSKQFQISAWKERDTRISCCTMEHYNILYSLSLAVFQGEKGVK